MIEIKSSNDMAPRIFDELKKYNDQFFPKVNYEPVTFYAEDDGAFLGGLDGYKAWDGFEISNMVVLKRKQGIGRRLIEQVEVYCYEHKLTKITAWTLDFQAPEFYKKCGFECFAVVPNSAGEHACHFMIKRLSS